MPEKQLLNALCRMNVDLQQQAIFQSTKATKIYMRVHSYTCAYVYTRERNYNFLFPISDSSDKNQQPNASLDSLTIYQNRSARKK